MWSLWQILKDSLWQYTDCLKLPEKLDPNPHVICYIWNSPFCKTVKKHDPQDYNTFLNPFASCLKQRIGLLTTMVCSYLFAIKLVTFSFIIIRKISLLICSKWACSMSSIKCNGNLTLWRPCVPSDTFFSSLIYSKSVTCLSNKLFLIIWLSNG